MKTATPPLSRRKRILFTLLTLGFLAFFVEASLQVFYRVSVGRWYWEWWAIPIYEADPVRVYRMKSNLDFVHQTSEFTARYRTDEMGLRTAGRQPSPSVAKPENTFRILTLGPSFAFGWGVNYEDSYVLKIADGLRVPGKRVELINLGTPSQPISQQLKWLKETGHRYQPDLIVQTVYGDLGALETDDVLPAALPTVRDGYLYQPGTTGAASWAKKARLYSATVYFGWRIYNAVSGARSDVTGDGREFYKKVEAPSGNAMDEVARRYRRYLDFVGRAVTNQPQIVFVHVPASYVVRPADITRFATYGHVETPVEARVKATRLTSLLQSNGVDMINPTELLVHRDQATRMYYLYDIHFTPAGNQAVADYALPLIQEAVRRRAALEK